MTDLTRGERLQIMLTREELRALDDWRFSKRMPSRASAVRELLKRGLTAEGFSDGGRRRQVAKLRHDRGGGAAATARQALRPTERPGG